MTDKQLTNKNKKSKSSKLKDDFFNEFIIKHDVSLGRLAKELGKPYNRLSSAKNPFLLRNHDDRALLLLSLIDKIHDFSLDCVDPDFWILPEKKEVAKKRKELLKKRDKIRELIDSLMPKEATKEPAHNYIRYCRYDPKLLIIFIDIIVSILKENYTLIKLDRRYRSKDTDAKRKIAVEIFLEKQSEDFFKIFSKSYAKNGIKPARKGVKWLKDLEVSKIYHRGYSYPKVALKIISSFAKCDYHALVEIRTEYNKEIKSPLNLIK